MRLFKGKNPGQGSPLDRFCDRTVHVVGSGPAGLMAAIHAAATGMTATVLEANPIAGRKLLLTGGGRCNLTHLGSPPEILEAFGPKGRFLRHCIHEFPPARVIELFDGLGLQVRAERDGCAFPWRGRAVRVRDALLGEAHRRGVTILYGRRVEEILRKPELGFLIKTADEAIHASRVILATGGLSYPQTGSTGHGLEIAQSIGHTIVQPRPALVPLVCAETWPGHLAGLSIGSATVTARPAGRRICETGALLFTRDGIGGPVVLNLSRHLTELLPNHADPVKVSIDLLPASTEDGLERQVLRWTQTQPRRTLAGLLADLVPRRLAEVLTRQAGCPGDLRISHLSKENRRGLVKTLKALQLHIVATRPMAEATITRGGVATDQIDPKTMQSRLCPGLFFAGEVIDVDGPCGGYNLQACWATGALAGVSAG